jgi:hypothetical protein
MVTVKLPTELVDAWLDVEPAAEGDYCWVNVVRTLGDGEVESSVAIYLPDNALRIAQLVRDRIDEAVRDDAAAKPDKLIDTHSTTKEYEHVPDWNLGSCGLRAVAVGEGPVVSRRDSTRTTLEIPLADILAMGLSAVVP